MKKLHTIIFFLTMAVAAFAQPANDNCSGATNLGTLPTPGACSGGIQNGSPVTLNSQTTVGATANNPYVYLSNCEGSGTAMAAPALDTWYSFVASGTTVNISVSGFTGVNIALWEGTSCSSLAGRGCSVDGTFSVTQITIGNTYYIQVSGNTSTLTDNSFSLSVDNDIDCNNCLTGSSITASPMPTNGAYTAGQVVHFCYQITGYSHQNTNWLHGVQVSYGSGWSGISNLSPAASCSGSGTWVWQNSCTSTATGNTFGPGFYYDYSTGAAGAGNNLGDNCAQTGTNWTFCFDLTAASSCNPGSDLSVTINTSGDGESGSWSSTGCAGDYPTIFNAIGACCPPGLTVPANVSCNGGTNGSITSTPVGNQAPYTYVWTGPSYNNTQNNVASGPNTISGLAAGTYTLNITDHNNCLQTATVTVTQPTAIVATVTPTNPSCTGTGSIAITGMSGGTSPYDISTNGGTSYSVNNVTANQNITGLAAGTYTVMIRDNNNCTKSFTVTLTPTGSVTSAFSAPAAQCLTGNSYSFTPSSTGSIVAGTTTYSWNFGDGGTAGPTTSTTAQTHSYAAAGTYTVSLTTTTGSCTNTYTTTITVNPMPATPTATLTNPTCGLSNGAINITGPGTTYSFNGGAYSSTTSYTGLAPGTYTVSVRNGTTCTTTTTFVLTNVPGPTAIGLTSATAHCGNSDGSVLINSITGGTSGYTYSFNASGGPFTAFTPTVTVGSLAAGTYTVYIKDSNGCPLNNTVTVANAPGPTAQVVTPTSANCGTATGQVVFGGTTGGTSPYTYSFNGGAYSSTTTYTGLLPGTYNVSVKDVNGCIFNTTVTVGSNPGPTALALTQTPASCGASDGQITIGAVTGGTAAYTYSFNNGPYTATSPITGLVAGTYSVSVKDANGCVFTNTVTVTTTSGPTDLTMSTLPATCGASNGEIDVTGETGGSGAMTYSIDGGAFNSGTSFTGLASGTHTITVKDGFGCTYSETIGVSSSTGPTALAVTSTPSACNPSDGTVTIGTVTGGTSPYTYDLNGSGFTATTNYTGLAAGTYPVSVKDANGCVYSTTVTVSPSSPPTAQAVTTTNSTCGNANGVVTIGATTGGTPAYTYSFNGGGFSATTSYTIAAGTYSVIVKDSKGCTYTTTATVANTPGPTAVALTPTNSTCGNSNGSVTVGTVTTSGSTTFQYSIDGGALQSGTSFTGLSASTHTILVQDANGCQLTQTVNVANTPGPTAQVVTPTNSTCGNPNGSINIGATTGGTPTITFQLDGSGGFTTTTNYTGLTAGTHTVVVHDANSCPLTVTVTVGNTPGPTAVALTQVPSNCGTASGSVTVGTVTGGTAAYQYSINGGAYQAGTTFSSLIAGVYTVTVQDVNNCTVTNTITVNNVGAPTVTLASQTNVSCFGGNNGSATFTATGGAGGYTYTLNTGASNLTGIFSGLAQGTYTVTVTDAAGCPATQTLIITQPTALSGNIVSQADPLCNAGTNGSLEVGGLSGTPAYTYSLNGGAYQGSGIFSGLASGTYTVTVKDSKGCTFPVPVTLSQPSPLTVGMSSVNANCTAANGTATAAPSGGTPGYTYTWTPSGGNGATTTGVVAGNYSVTIADSHSCTVTGSTTIGVTPGGTASAAVVAQVSCNGGSDGSITVSMSATTATSYTYVWTPNVGSTATVTGLPAGTYTVNVTDNFGCTSSANAAVTEPAPLTMTLTSTNVSCNGGNDGTINANVIGGTSSYNYVWTPNVGSSSTVGTLFAGTYSVMVTDAHGCVVNGTRNITEPTALAITPTVGNSHCNQSDGSITVTGSGGAGGYTFAINGGTYSSAGSFTGLAANTYSISIKDVNGCIKTFPVTVTDLAGPTATISATNPVLCNGGNTGSATVSVTGGILPYTYLWQNGSVTTSATGLTAGIWTVTVTDSSGCVASAGATITQPTVLTVTASGVDPKCNGGNNGTASAGAVGGTPGSGYLYSWSTSPAQNTANATGLTAGPYIVTVTDANQCTATATVTLNNPPALTASASATNLTCYNICNGTATAVIGNATLPIQYAWTGGQSTSTASGLCAGTYTVNVTDANGCTASTSTTITQPTQLVANIPTTGNETCYNACNGFAQGTATGGTPNYTFTWSNSFIGANDTALCAGNYTLTVTDNHGCTATATTTVTAPTPMQLTLTKQDISCNYAPPYPAICDGHATASVTGGTGPYSYLWSPSNYTINNPVTLCSGLQTVVVTDANGCTISGNVNIIEPPEFSIVLDADSSHCLFNDGATNVLVTGGATPHTILWSNGVNTPYNPGIPGGQYTISVTDAVGCNIQSSVVVNDIHGPSASIIDSTMITCYGANNGTATAQVIGGTLPYQSMGWQETSQPGLNASNLPPGWATFVVYDSAGCVGGDVVYITQPTDIITAVVNHDNVTCYNLFNGDATINSNGGTGNYTMSLYNPTQTQAGIAQGTNVLFSGLGVGPTGSNITYTVMVTDQNGCKDSTTVTISQPQALVISNPIISDISCNGLPTPDGSISITATGGTPLYTYSWTSTAGGFTNPGTPNASGLAAGTYTLVLTDSHGCTDNDQFSINEPPPLLLDSTVVTATCGGANGSAIVNPTGGTPGYTYQWNNAPSNSITQTVNNLAGNTYLCTVTDAHQCQAQINVVVPNAAGPQIDSVAVQNLSCYNNLSGSATVMPSGGTPGYSYSFINSSGTQVGSTLSPTVNGLQAGAYSIVVTDQNSCFTAANFTVFQPTALSMIASNNASFCYGDSTRVDATVAGGTPPYTYNWYVDGSSAAYAPWTLTGVSTTSLFHYVHPSYNPSNHTYNIQVTDVNNCPVASQTVAITALPPIYMTSQSITACDGGAVVLTANATGGNSSEGGTFSYLWTPGSVTTNTISVTAQNNTNHYQVLNVTASDGCSRDTTVHDTIRINPTPLVNIFAGNTRGCTDLTVTLAGTAGNGFYNCTYDWDFGDGSTHGSDSVTTHIYSNNTLLAQTFDVTLTVTSPAGCVSSLSVNDTVTVYPKPKAEFTYDPLTTTEFDPEIHFYDQSLLASSWAWNFGDSLATISNSSTDQNPAHVYSAPAHYDVELIVISPKGCKDTVIHQIYIEPEFAIYVPNAFSPNIDGKNETFYPTGIGIDEDRYHMYIFDRWGDLIYETNKLDQGWDGKANGGANVVQQDVYIYKIIAYDLQNNKHDLTGHVTVVR